MKGSLIIIAFFILGCVCGGLGLVPPMPDDLDISFFTLCALMMCVGFSLGNDPETLKNSRP